LGLDAEQVMDEIHRQRLFAVFLMISVPEQFTSAPASPCVNARSIGALGRSSNTSRE